MTAILSRTEWVKKSFQFCDCLVTGTILFVLPQSSSLLTKIERDYVPFFQKSVDDYFILDCYHLLE